MDYERKPIPKTAFDSEYMTEFLREVRFLTEKGIKYTFVKKTKDYGISQYKYRKTPSLFAALVEFYSIIEAEKALKKSTEKNALSQEQIKQAQEILEKAVRQNVIKTEEKDDTI